MHYITLSINFKLQYYNFMRHDYKNQTDLRRVTIIKRIKSNNDRPN